MNRELKGQELALEQRGLQLSAEYALHEESVKFEEASTEIRNQYALELKTFNARAEVEMAEYPEPVAPAPVVEKETE